MSVISSISSDISYGANMLAAVLQAKKNLFETYIGPADGEWTSLLYHLEEMRFRIPFDPWSKRGEQMPDLTTFNGFEYRQPVWDIVSSVLAVQAQKDPFEGTPLRRFRYDLRATVRYNKTRVVLDNIQAHLLETYGKSRGGILITEDEEASGKNAKTRVEKILDELIVKLTDHVEKK